MDSTKTKSFKPVDGRLIRGPLLVFAIGMALTLFVTAAFYETARSEDRKRFEIETSRIRYATQAQIDLYVGLLTATRGFLENTSDLNLAKFKHFVGDLGIQKTYQGIQGIGYSKLVKPGEVDDLTRRMRAEGETRFVPYPESNRQIEQSIIYLEPQDERNKSAIGFDMSSETNRKEALDRARDTAAPAASARVILVGEMVTNQKQPGFLIYLPVYTDGIEPDTLEKRRANLLGFVYAPVRGGDFFAEVRRTIGNNQLLFKVFEGSEVTSSLLDEDSSTEYSDKKLPFISLAPRGADEMEVYGRRWIIEYKASDAFMSGSRVWWTPVVLAFGTLFSIALFVFVRKESKTRLAAEHTATELIEAEKSNQVLLEKESVARRNAEDAGRVKDEFISVVSHELRTPLNAIAGWIRVLKGPNVPAVTYAAALEKIDRNLRLQTSLVDDLLTATQIASGSYATQFESFDICSVMDSVLSEIEPALVERKLSVNRRYDTGGRWIVGDADKLRMVLLKFLNNAVKYTPERGTIDATVKIIDGTCVLSVKDTGRGISPEFLPQIFERFTQHDTSITRRFGGLGLGLAICQHIVTLHGGQIEAKSAGENQGAEFIVTLPVAGRG